jgi:hypothetical protein
MQTSNTKHDLKQSLLHAYTDLVTDGQSSIVGEELYRWSRKRPN